jgi:sortase (surface protein transpeptidase)
MSMLRGRPAPPAEPLVRAQRLRALGEPTPAASPRPGFWRSWWAPTAQAAAIAAVLLTGAGFIDATAATTAADLAADQGKGARLAVTRAAIKHAAPVAVTIPRIGVRSSLVDLRKNPNGTVQVPADFQRAGWYVGSSHPGDAGPTVLIGHVDSKTGPGVFYRLPQLKKGDVINVTRADRSTAQFRVQYVKRFAKRSFPTALVYKGEGKASLRLVTCGGGFDKKTGHYLDNTIVFAAPVLATKRVPLPHPKAAVHPKPAAKPKPAAPRLAPPLPRPVVRTPTRAPRSTPATSTP